MIIGSKVTGRLGFVMHLTQYFYSGGVNYTKPEHKNQGIYPYNTVVQGKTKIALTYGISKFRYYSKANIIEIISFERRYSQS